MEFHIQTASTPKDYLQNSRDFCEAAKRCLYGESGIIVHDGKLSFLPIPTVVNSAFSCEMSLKAILLSRGVNIPTGRDGHNLETLFQKIDKKTQEIISRSCMPKNVMDPHNAFLSILRKHKNDFTETRYYVEKTCWQEMSPMTMLAIANNLLIIAGDLIEGESKSN